ncbi:unnamed protein product [Amoebophrya sp. A25]|nr:unnamed protein product [Amoebophrya sp. A25]|eukprot:GSA25T00010703001.1
MLCPRIGKFESCGWRTAEAVARSSSNSSRKTLDTQIYVEQNAQYVSHDISQHKMRSIEMLHSRRTTLLS